MDGENGWMGGVAETNKPICLTGQFGLLLVLSAQDLTPQHNRRPQAAATGMGVWGLQRWHVALGLLLVWLVTQNRMVCAITLVVVGVLSFVWMRLRCPPQPGGADEDKIVARLRAGGVVAHRGGSRDAPENTMSALRVALEQKAIGCEVDIGMSLDGQAILIHGEPVGCQSMRARPMELSCGCKGLQTSIV